MGGMSRRCYKACRCRETVHRALCQRRWAGPPAHGALANHPGPRDQDPPTGRQKGAARLRALAPQAPSPSHDGDHTPTVAANAATVVTYYKHVRTHTVHTYRIT